MPHLRDPNNPRTTLKQPSVTPPHPAPASQPTLECTQNRLRPIEKGLHSASVTTRSPAT